MYTSEYKAPILTVDSVIFQIINGQLSVLLIKRSQEPFLNCYALPGGYCAAGETTTSAMTRITSLKAGVDADKLPLVEQLYTFDTVARDPRGHAVSVTYMGAGRDLTPLESSATQAPGFFAVNELPELAYDHRNIIMYAVERLQSKLGYTNAAFALLPPFFSLTELQAAYEAVFNKPFDKRNFRKKLLSLDLVEDTGQMQKQGAHRPARLYKFRQSKLQPLDRSFD
jgi:8-oxo-dGTP diphosphatase